MNDKLIQLYRGVALASSKESYDFISQVLYPTDSQLAEQLVTELDQRERTGNLQIDEGVVLPHIESDLIKKTTIMILQPVTPIETWNDTIAKIDLVIVVLLSSQESKEGKQRVAAFMRKLADEDFLNELRNLKTIGDLTI